MALIRVYHGRMTLLLLEKLPMVVVHLDFSTAHILQHVEPSFIQNEELVVIAASASVCPNDYALLHQLVMVLLIELIDW